MQMGLKDTNQLLQRLPLIFNEYPSSAMILVLNQKSKLLGSLYEAERISQSDYNEILKNYKTMEYRKFQFVKVLTGSGISIWVIGNREIGIFNYIIARLKSNPGYIFILAAYTLVLLVLLMSWVFDKPVVVREEERPAPDLPEYKIPENRKASIQGKYLENKIVLLMDTIEKTYSTIKVAFYSREGGKWRHILEKSGNLVIKGDVAIEYLPLEITEIADKNWREPLISFDKKILFVPLNYRNNLFGLLRIHFSGLASEVTSESLNQLAKLCSNYSHAIFMQRIYDKAITDPETDFYNYPYFYFMVKEKLSADKKFAVVVFEVSGFNRISPESTRNWSADLVNELTQKGLKPLIAARLERSRFSLLYEVGHKESEIENLSELNKIPSIIKNITSRSFKQIASLNGGFYIRPTGYEDTDTFMQRLDYLIINSKFQAFSMDFEDHISSGMKKPA